MAGSQAADARPLNVLNGEARNKWRKATLTTNNCSIQPLIDCINDLECTRDDHRLMTVPYLQLSSRSLEAKSKLMLKVEYLKGRLASVPHEQGAETSLECRQSLKNQSGTVSERGSYWAKDFLEQWTARYLSLICSVGKSFGVRKLPKHALVEELERGSTAKTLLGVRSDETAGFG
ncbi:predicted protein [Sclerotinia sclerotiorum 1980 UF-70]|uniref:Uncharacterized protein n=1 Tax=Sclerotinia sclerotiorum (strain ATCC 18683 / 1980 / Ss-1) TaxID=665079 RepID=A7EW83_SCLS1|nr:predicted protein [Sclerotinia sclerotiorum 1980 UF-70]EDN93725.1 predicted protein [Sclerotinia sclerotiorum 1980 UF-70]